MDDTHIEDNNWPGMNLVRVRESPNLTESGPGFPKFGRVWEFPKSRSQHQESRSITDWEVAYTKINLEVIVKNFDIQ